MNNDSEFNKPLIKVISASDVTEINKEERRQEAINKFMVTGGLIASRMAISELMKRSDRVQDTLRKSNFFNVTNTTVKSSGSSANWTDMKSKIDFSDISLEVIRRAEELSPFKILHTFGLSHFLMPLIDATEMMVDISPATIELQEDYFSKLLSSQGETKLTAKHKDRGLRLKDGALYEIDADGKTGAKVIKHARIVSPFFNIPKDEDKAHIISYKNRTLKQYANIIGADGEFDNIFHNKEEPWLVIGAKSKSKLGYDWFRSYARDAFERGASVFDAPLDHIIDYFGDNKIADWGRKHFRANLGTKGQYNQSIPKSLGMMAKNIATKSLIAGVAWAGAESIMTSVLDEDNPYSKGIIPGISTNIVNAHTAWAETFSDKFQDYKESQEYIAPGSTSLIGMAGLPLAAAMNLGIISYGKRTYDTIRSGFEVAERAADEEKLVFPSMKGKIGKIKASRAKRWGMRAGLLALAIEAPLIPGALIGEKSEDLKAEYSGEKDVAVRKNRWWFSGGTEYEGQNIKYFTKGWYARTMAEADTKSLYGDKETEREMNPLLNPIDYLRDPYQFEKMHQDDRPYPIWGMNISYGSFFGKAFEKTIGAFIKPDVLNPRLANQLATEGDGQLLYGMQGDGPRGALKDLQEAQAKGEFDITTPVSKTEAELIEEGMMLPPASATYEPGQEAAGWSFAAFKDFLGLKGWALGLTEESFSLDIQEVSPQLARSGEATNMARAFRDINIGGAFGVTEAQRRFLPTNSGMLGDRINPLINTMASWLPGDDDSHYLNFSRGDPFTLIEGGNTRLPGQGYSALHTELEGLDPEHYPDIYKYKILSDVALGSDAYYRVKDRIGNRVREGSLTDHEVGIYNTIKDQEKQRSQKKRFNEYKGEQELEQLGSAKAAISGAWETLTHNAQTPVGNLTFFRPAAKMLHQRTAIEDYEKTQLVGSDVALWTKPYEHFIKPAMDQTARIVKDDYIPQVVEERRNVDEYFDKLQYMKFRNLYKEAVASGEGNKARNYQAEYQKTMIGAVSSGMDNKVEVMRAYVSLSAEEKPYFASFVNANQKQRGKILEMVSDEVKGLYQTLWDRKDTVQLAIENGEDIEGAIAEQVQSENRRLISNFSDEYETYMAGDRSSSSFREYLMDNRAGEHISSATGMPDEDFVGWDPRIDLDSVKLRTLSIGGEDMHNFGFWDTDMEELSRLTAVLEEDQVVNDLDSMKQDILKKRRSESEVVDVLYNNGYNVRNIAITESSDQNITLNVETN